MTAMPQVAKARDNQCVVMPARKRRRCAWAAHGGLEDVHQDDAPVRAPSQRLAPGGPSRGFGRGWEKLQLAVQVLTGTATPRDRLAMAVVDHLVHIDPAQDLPYELRDEFAAFIRDLTRPRRGIAADDDRLPLQLATLPPTAVQRAFDRIIDYYDTVCRYMPRQW